MFCAVNKPIMNYLFLLLCGFYRIGQRDSLRPSGQAPIPILSFFHKREISKTSVREFMEKVQAQSRIDQCGDHFPHAMRPFIFLARFDFRNRIRI